MHKKEMVSSEACVVEVDGARIRASSTQNIIFLQFKFVKENIHVIHYRRLW